MAHTKTRIYTFYITGKAAEHKVTNRGKHNRDNTISKVKPKKKHFPSNLATPILSPSLLEHTSVSRAAILCL